MSHTIIDFKGNYIRVDEIDLIITCLLVISINRDLITQNFPELEKLWLNNFTNSANGCTDLELELLITDDIKKNIFLKILHNTIIFIEENATQNILNIEFLNNQLKNIKLIVDIQYPNKNLINVLAYLIKIFDTH